MGFRMKKGEDTAAFLAINRNKKSMTLNLKEDEAREIFYRLAREADVVVENYRPGVTKKLGVDYETLKAINPRLIYASISGFGQTGPYADRAGYDLIAQGMSGVMSVTGEPAARPRSAASRSGTSRRGSSAPSASLPPTIAREETGRGQYIDTSLFEGALAFSIWETAELWATGRIPQPFGSAHRLTAPYQALKTSDGYVNVGANNQRLWARLCNAIGREELIEDERFATNADRMNHREELVEELESVLKDATRTSGRSCSSRMGCPSAPFTTTSRCSKTRILKPGRWWSR